MKEWTLSLKCALDAEFDRVTKNTDTANLVDLDWKNLVCLTKYTEMTENAVNLRFSFYSCVQDSNTTRINIRIPRVRIGLKVTPAHSAS
ncbi:MAG: hypothetical protein JSV58_05745 [Candidatus Bathyarchaeota archaeon]|nr:MAG: hypothetical protein JSV58_05745 [Candidatus Bathyarchaeota archaeon]